MQTDYKMFQVSFKGVSSSRVFQGCFKAVSWVFQGSFKGVSRGVQRCFKEISCFLRLFKGCSFSKEILRVFQGKIKVVSRVFQ